MNDLSEKANQKTISHPVFSKLQWALITFITKTTILNLAYLSLQYHPSGASFPVCQARSIGLLLVLEHATGSLLTLASEPGVPLSMPRLTVI